MLNQLLIPISGTLHQSLTFDNIDLSDSHFSTRSYKRATLLEFASEFLDKNDHIFTYAFTSKGYNAHLITVYNDGNMFAVEFRLDRHIIDITYPSSKYMFRDYIAAVLGQRVLVYPVDYQHTKSFVHL